MSVNEYKQVWFHEYCEDCKHKEVANVDEPCNSCLDEPINLHTHRPVKFEAKES